jgi:Fe-S oxidoreductase/nitrate reductase gamma subunit
MGPTREIYWNVGHGVVLFMYLGVAITLAIMAYGFWRRARVYHLGKPLRRLDQLPRRVWRLVTQGLAQLRVLLVKRPGLVHALLFWGLLLLFIGTLIIMLQVDFTQPLFGLTILQGTFYEIYSLVLDCAGVAAFLMLCGFAIRRYILKPTGLPTSWEDIFILSSLALILLSGFLVEGLRMAVTEVSLNTNLARFSPIGLLVAQPLAALSESTLRAIHRVGWWGHYFLVMALLAAVPFTKLRHLFLTPLNYLFADLREKGAIETLNLEAEAASFGAAQVADLSWKDIYDADACTLCKRCQDRCPAWKTEKPLSPMKVMLQIGEVAFTHPEASLITTITPEVLWNCTTCSACQAICPADIEHVNKILELRRHLVLMQGELPGPEVMTALNNTEINGNPFGLAYATRGDWAAGLEVAHLAEGETAEILYFAGCFASFDKRNQAVARNLIKICTAAGIKVGLLGKDEKCCGEPMRKLGNEYLYQMLANENIQRMRASGVKRIVTTCPHCFNTLWRDYKDLGLDLPVEHYTAFLERLLAQGVLHIKPQELDCTYHDSCYLARYKGLTAAPRAVLQRAGAQIHEMEQSGLESFCCGGGGGLILAEEKVGRRINVERIKMAQATKAPVLVSNCPFCLTMFEDGVKTAGGEGQLQVHDLSEIIVERLAA